MSDIFKDLEKSLPSECLAAINSGEAEVVFKNGNFVILDKADIDLFKVLPLIFTKFGFSIVICSNGKTYYTTLGEIICRVKGIVRFKNNFKCDFRRCNLDIAAWGNRK